MRFDTATRREFLKAGAGAVAATSAGSIVLSYETEAAEPVTVTVCRDGYGVPHVFARGADGPAPVFFGYGFAVAEDRLFQLEMQRRFYRGTVAAVLGAGEDDAWIDFDREARRNRSIRPGVGTQLEERLGDEHREVLRSFADGVNRYIEEIRNSDREFHRGFHEYEFEPEQWDTEDVAGSVVAFLEFFSGFQLETLGAAVLKVLRENYDTDTANELFADVQPGEDPGAPTSGVPNVGYTPPYTPAEPGPFDGGRSISESTVDGLSTPHATESRAASRSDRSVEEHRIPTDAIGTHEREMDRLGTLASGLDALGLPIKLGSNALAVSGDLTESGDALLYGGPQMGFSSPSVMYEVGLHGPDFDVTGTTVTGAPFVMFGHNRDGAFTSTAGVDNAVQMFVESLVETDNGYASEFRGGTSPVEERTETIPVKGADDADVTIRRTRHGVVTDWLPDEDEALAKTRTYEGRELDGFCAFYDAQFAEDVTEFANRSAGCPYPVNLLWADAAGDIGFFHLGRYPDPDAVDWDLRLPADGSKHDLTEGDIRSAAAGDTPFIVNPERGYTASWNNKPDRGWENGDLSYAWGTDHRVQRIINSIEHRLDEERAVSYAFLKDIVRDIAFVDLRAIRYKKPILAALDDAALNPTEQDAADALRAWGNYRQADGETFLGQYPAGFTVFDATFQALLGKTFRPTFGAAFDISRDVFFDYRYGRPLLLRALNPDTVALPPATDYFGGDPEEVIIDAFRDAVASLSAEFGDDVSAWRRNAAVDTLSNLALFGMPIGVGDAGDMPFMNRGTENHFVRLDGAPGTAHHAEHRRFTAENVLPPGQSGYVTPDGTRDEHYADQLEMFLSFEYKDLLFTRSQVATEQNSIRALRND